MTFGNFTHHAQHLERGGDFALAGLAGASVAPNAVVLGIALVSMGFGGALIWVPSPAIAARAVGERQRGLELEPPGDHVSLVEGAQPTSNGASPLTERADKATFEPYDVGRLFLMRTSVHRLGACGRRQRKCRKRSECR